MIQLVRDIVEANGKTIRENNLERKHDIPIGALVEIESNDYDDKNPTNGLRLWVVNHSRDCDGTPLYDLSHTLNAQKEHEENEAKREEALISGDISYAMWHSEKWRCVGMMKRHYGRESLKVIKLPSEKNNSAA